MNLKDIVDMMTVERNIELLSERDQDQCQGGTGKKKKYLGSIFFFQASGGNLTYLVIRHMSIYSNSRDVSVLKTAEKVILLTPQQFSGINGFIQRLRWYTTPLRACCCI
jgi:hypothetical protein